MQLILTGAPLFPRLYLGALSSHAIYIQHKNRAQEIIEAHDKNPLALPQCQRGINQIQLRIISFDDVFANLGHLVEINPCNNTSAHGGIEPFFSKRLGTAVG